MPNASRRAAPRKEVLTLLVSPANKRKLLALLDVLHLAEVETPAQQLARFGRNAPAAVPLTDDDLRAELRAVRAGNTPRA